MTLDPKSEDEVARTATSPVGATEPSAPPTHVEETLGRYRIERQLGAGGMGVVYQAFDPELERRVALKVLAQLRSSPEAHERLLREARAMARLNHPNVVTVYEAGSVGGRDYVAMELVTGETLNDWLHAAKRSTDEIIVAFTAAGRGLAAAHDAGMIHRDFKPHNVMRDAEGNIAVTDFGLAGDVNVELEPASASRNTPSPLGGLTQTGSILGTPAYMAPEQWRGGTVGPKADQFAFCVALWEALAGERPFRGNGDELRAAAERGPSHLDITRIPRRLRDLVLRGLEPDPDKRWPSMKEVLAKLERARRRTRIVFAAAGVLAVAGVIAGAFFLTRGPTTPPCAPPALDPATVWPAGELVQLIRKDQATAGLMMSHDMLAWLDTRADACHREPLKRAPILTCLDGMIGKLDIVRRAIEATKTPRVDPGPFLLDPSLCKADQPPRLAPLSNTSRTLVGTWLANHGIRGNHGTIDTSLATVFSDTCARPLSTLLELPGLKPSAVREGLDDALLDAETCGDDQLLFLVTLADVDAELDEPLSNKIDEKLQRLRSRLDRVKQPDTEAEVGRVSAINDFELGRHAEAKADLVEAVAGFTARGRPSLALVARMVGENFDERLREPATIAAIPATLDRWYADAVRELGPDDIALVGLAYKRAYWQGKLGNLAASHAAVAKLRRTMPNNRSRDVKGRVVDMNHQPVAGATVSIGADLEGDSLIASLPLWDGTREVTTDAHGQFLVAGAFYDSTAIAQLGERRSRPTSIGDDELELVLEPTHRLVGHITLDAPAPTYAIAVYPYPLSFDSLHSTWPRADGTFELDGVLGGKNLVVAWSIGAHQTMFDARVVDVTTPTVDVTFDRMRSQRVVHVILRSPSNGREGVTVALLRGRHKTTTLDETTNKYDTVLVKQRVHPESSQAPDAIDAQVHTGDLVATFDHVPDTITSVCAIPTPKTTVEPFIRQRVSKVEVPCMTIAPTDAFVVLEFPPIPRFE